MSTLTLEAALANLDKTFRTRLISSYEEIKSRYAKSLYNSEFDTAGLSAGKFCETVLRFLQKHHSGTYLPFGKHIKNFNDECRKIISSPKSTDPADESLRIIVPRALLFLYTLRGKRGIGHVGGDVEANMIDTETIIRITDWIVCEFIRIFHGVSLEEAQAIVDNISEKSIPEIWEVAGRKRILVNGLGFKERTLLLVYQSIEGFEFDIDLYNWVEYSSFSMYKKSVLLPLHKTKYIEYDQETNLVYISPFGIREVEQIVFPKIR